MTPNEHYKEAERLMTEGLGQLDHPIAMEQLAAAQVHATLATATSWTR